MVDCETCEGSGEVAYQRCGHQGAACPCGPNYASCSDCEGTGRVEPDFEYHPSYEPYPSEGDMIDMASDYAYDEWRNG